jgi:hypothetical protein
LAETSSKARILDSPAVRIRWLAGPKALTRGAGWGLLGLLLMVALARLTFAFFGDPGLFLLMPLGFFSLLLSLMALFCGASGLFLWLLSLFSRRRRGSLWIEDALCVELGRERAALPLVAVTFAHVSPDTGELSLRTRDGDRVEASVDTPATVHRVLDAIAAGTVHGTWTASIYRSVDRPFWLPSSPLAAVVLTTLGTVVTCLVTTLDLALALGFTLGMGGMAWAALRDAAAAEDCVVVGSDGLSIRQGSAERFIAFTRITAVSEVARGVLFSLAGGEQVEVTLICPDLQKGKGGGALSVALADKRRAHLIERVRAEIAPREPDAIRAAALLERKGRSLRAWRVALGELLREAGGDYRRATLSKDQAAQVLEDGKAPAELRIGAALALSPDADQMTAVRLRVAIETCVNPAVRLALTKVSYGELDDETLESALLSAEAEAEEAAPPPPAPIERG